MIGRHPRPILKLTWICALALLSGAAFAQVHHHPDGRPWNQKTNSGPDADAGGWFYNLGPTGLRIQLSDDAPKEMEVSFVLPESPAAGRIKIGDHILGVDGSVFEKPHKNGYGMDRFGADGPIGEFAEALYQVQSKSPGKRGTLKLLVRRGEEERQVSLRLAKNPGPFATEFPADCPRSKRQLRTLLDYLVKMQNDRGSWGSPPQDTFAPLAMLATNPKRYRKSIEKSVRFHARSTKAQDSSSLINWRYMAAALVLSEYYLATKKSWVKNELEEVYDFLISTQFVADSQINPKSKESHPDAQPRSDIDSKGGWGHNPGFEGYGPIAMISAQGALAFSMIQRCGIDVDRERHDAAYEFLARGTGRNGYLWYGDEAAGQEDWADMGRTGASAIAHFMSPYQEDRYRERAEKHARIIGAHPQSFPDTHASPLMGMGYTALGALHSSQDFRSLMNANRWWFVLAECPDGSFYYQPNRDNAGYGPDARIAASAISAFILSLPNKGLVMTGRQR